MKFFKLSPFTRQLIIFLLLAALLWNSRPLVGPDGSMLVEFTIFPGDPPSGGFISDDSYILIYEVSLDELTGKIKADIILSSIPLAKATWKEPNKTYLFINEYVSLGSTVPRRLRLNGGWILVLRLTPEEYDILQVARQRGKWLDFVKMTKREAEAYLKWKKLPYLEQQRLLIRLLLQGVRCS